MTGAEILVTGGNGAIGRALRSDFPDAVYLGHDELDVGDRLAVSRAFSKYAPSIVIHAAAITDHQTTDISELIRTNIVGTHHVTAAAAGAFLIYLSTHYVYPGVIGGYQESDNPAPIGHYAWSKLAGEHAVGSSRGPRLVVRGSWYTPEKLRLWEKQCVCGAFSSRIAVSDAAKRIANLVRCGARGTFNIGGPRRSFQEILSAEGRSPRKTVTISELNKELPYPFPTDTSVNFEKYTTLVSEVYA